MADIKQNIVTQEGMKQLQDKLDEHLRKRTEIAGQIEFARGYGDLSENAEYTEAKNDQAKNEEEIARLEQLIRTAVVVSEISNEKAAVGVSVKLVVVSASGEITEDLVVDGEVVVEGIKAGQEVVYAIVGSEETDPLSNKISNESGLGAALMGKTVGDVFDFEFTGNSRNPSVVEYEGVDIFH